MADTVDRGRRGLMKAFPATAVAGLTAALVAGSTTGAMAAALAPEPSTQIAIAFRAWADRFEWLERTSGLSDDEIDAETYYLADREEEIRAMVPTSADDLILKIAVATHFFDPGAGDPLDHVKETLAADIMAWTGRGA